MHRFFRERFEVVRVLRNDKGILSFLGRDHWTDDHQVVVKCFSSGTYRSLPDLESRLARLHGIRHPLLADIYSAGFSPRKDFFVSREHCPSGGSAATMPTPNPKFVGSLLAACRFFHSQRIPHGRIKPGNVLAGESLVKLLDGGLPPIEQAFMNEEDLCFMAPELLTGSSPNVESDLYSVGALLYRLFAGSNIFRDSSLELLRHKCIHARPLPLNETSNISAPLSDAVGRLLSKEPADRTLGFRQLTEMFPFPPTPVSRTHLIGRDDEVALALHALSARDTGLRIVTVEGEAGIGKTRFVDELAFRYSVHHRHVLTGRCFERENRQFEPILQILASRFHRHDQTLSTWITTSATSFSRSLCDLLPGASDTLGITIAQTESELSAKKHVADLTGVLVSLSRVDSSLALILEDIHWADEGTLQILEQLSLRSGETDMRVILTARTPHTNRLVRHLMNPSSASDLVILPISLTPLVESTAIEIAEQLVDDPESVYWIVDNACGNPLILEECARYGGSTPDSLPPRIKDVVLKRLEALDTTHRSIAETLSLFPKPVELTVIKRVLTQLSVSDSGRTAELIADGLLRLYGDKIVFRHDGIRRTIYKHIAPGRRRTLHQTIHYVLLSEHVDEGSRAYHAEQAGMWKAARQGYERAGRRARACGHFQAAASLLLAAERASDRAGVKRNREIGLIRAECLMLSGRSATAKSVLMRLLTSRSPMSSEFLDRVYRKLGACTRSSPRESVRYHQMVVSNASKTGKAVAPALADLAQSYAMAGRLTDATGALAEADRLSNGSLLSRSDLRAVAAHVHISLGQFLRGRMLLESRTTRTPSPVLLTNKAICLEHLGQLDEAITHQKQALELSRQQGMLFGELQSLANLGAFEVKRGDFSKAATFFADAERFCRTMRVYRVGDRTNLPLLAADHGGLQMELGEYAKARSMITSAARQIKKDRASQKALWIAFKSAELAARSGDAARARRALRRVEQSELFKSAFFTVERALVMCAVGGTSLQERIALLQQALVLTHDLRTQHQRCRVLVELAAVEVETGALDHASTHLTQAHHLARQNGYGPLRARIALLRGLAADSARSRIRYLSVAHRLASELPLPELMAEAAYRIGEHCYRTGQILKAGEYCSKSVSITESLADRLSLRDRRAYLQVTWRLEARTMSREIQQKIRTAEKSVAPDRPRKTDPDLFKGIYETTKCIAASHSIDELVSVIAQGVTGNLKRGCIVLLTARDDAEFHEHKLGADATRAKRIKKLYESSTSEPYYGCLHGASTPPDDAPVSVAWIPLTSRNSRFGGLYLELGVSRLTEPEMEFLTTLGITSSGHLAALLWSDRKSVSRRAAPRYKGIVGVSAGIRSVCTQIEIASRSHATVLIEGESGTGKELVAKAIHQASPRSNGPLITLDCGAVPESLIESEIFGSRRGSFTGATVDRVGLIEGAHQGTLFLDEIGNTSPALQAKLLRVIQEREVRRVGDTRARSVDVRLIAATNSNLDSLVERGLFRQDLLFRLKVLHIRVPALRERREDIPELARSFLEQLNATNKTRKRFHEAALKQLQAGNYPGNVRELQNLVERAYYTAVDSNVIREVAAGSGESPASEMDDVRRWYAALTDEGKDFWTVVHRRYKARDISREKVVALMDLGLRATRGSYKSVAALFNVEDRQYRRFMDFLRRNRCQPDFRPYRRLGG